MVEEPSHGKQLSLNHVCKIGLKEIFKDQLGYNYKRYSFRPHPFLQQAAGQIFKDDVSAVPSFLDIFFMIAW
jgi:hypothetical protein